MNKVIMVGRTTRDPEIRYSADNKPVARFSLAVDRRFKKEGEPDADFFNCTAFGRTAEVIEKYLSKGRKIAITGRIQNDNYTDQTGIKRYSVNIIVDELEFCESKGSQEASSSAAPESASAGSKTEWATIPDDVDDDSLPFN